MNESRGAEGNSWTIPATWKSTTWKRPVTWSSTRSLSRSPMLQLVVGDGLLGDEDAVAHGRAAARSSGRRRRRGNRSRAAWSPGRSWRVDPVGVLEVRARRRRTSGRWRSCPARRGSRRSCASRPCVRDRPGRRGGGDVGAERELGVDVGLLVVGGGEDAEAHAEREQQPDHDEAAVDRCARAGRHWRAGTRAPCRARAAGGAWQRPTQRPPAQTHEQQRRAEPQQRRGEEHVHRQRQRGIGVRVDDGGEPGAGGQPVDQAAHRERDEIEVQPLPQRTAPAQRAATALADARPPHRCAGSEAGAQALRRSPAPRTRPPTIAARAGVSPTPPLTIRVTARNAAPAPSRPAMRPITTLSTAARRSRSRRVAPRARSRARSRRSRSAVPSAARYPTPSADQRPGDREHDVERLGVERIAGGGVELIGEVVDELHLAGQRALDAVGDLAGPACTPAPARPRGSRRRAAPGPATARRAGRRERRRRPSPVRRDSADRGRACRRTCCSGRIAALAGGCAGRGPEQRVQRCEHHVGRGDQRHPGDTKAPRARAGARCDGDRVADPRLQGRRQLLVEHDRPRGQWPPAGSGRCGCESR